MLSKKKSKKVLYPQPTHITNVLEFVDLIPWQQTSGSETESVRVRKSSGKRKRTQRKSKENLSKKDEVAVER